MSENEKEIEVKVKASPADIDYVFNELSALAIASKVKNKHRPRAYFDTKDREISKSCMALRVQYKEGLGYEQTLKYETSEAGIKKMRAMTRVEVKNLLPKKCSTPDLSLIDLSSIEDKTTRKIIKSMLNKELEHVFTSSVKRRYFSVTVNDAQGNEIGVVELAFDKGTIVHAEEKDLSYDVSEIEVELKTGSVKAVEIMTKKILEMIPTAKISSISKAKQGYMLDDEAQARKRKSKNVMKSLKNDCENLDKKSKKMLPKNK